MVAFNSAGAASVPLLPPLPDNYEGERGNATLHRSMPLSPLQITRGRFDFQFVRVAQLVSLLYGEAMKTPYVIAPEVLDDGRLVSFRYDARSGHLREFLAVFLASLGFEVETREGVDFVRKRLPAADEPAPEQDVYVYRPQYRDAQYLSRQVQPLFAGKFTMDRNIASDTPIRAGTPAPEGSAAAAIEQHSDTLIFHGTHQEIATLKRLLPLIDTQTGEVAVRAVAYEVSHDSETGSAFHAALDLLGQGVSLSIGGTRALTNGIRFKAKGADAVFSALAQDSRFKVINAPNLRIRSGATGRLTIGQKVPTLGAVTYPRGSTQPVQSIQYLSSGVIFELRPIIKENIIDIHISQQISDFMKTTTGVNNSPTLNTREIATDISVEDGDVILLGGLTTDKNADNRSGLSFLPRFLDGQATSRTQTEILLVLHVQKI